MLLVVRGSSDIISDPARGSVQTVQIVFGTAEVTSKLHPDLGTGKPSIEKVCSLWPDGLDTKFLGRRRPCEAPHDGGG
jgi:hypothetical protein